MKLEPQPNDAGAVETPSEGQLELDEHYVQDEHDVNPDFELPKYLLEDLPLPFRGLIASIEDPTKAAALLYASIASVGAALPFVETTYRGDPITPVFYFFLLGNAGSGKSIIAPARTLVASLDASIRKASDEEIRQFHRENAARANAEKDIALDVVPPAKKKFLFAANSTGAKMVRDMCNNPAGLIFDSEADTLKQALRAETGDISSALRQNWQREPISVSRVTNDLDITTSKPHVGIVISGTYSQVLPLVRDIENGLLSRFNFMWLNDAVVFEDPFAPNLSVPSEVAKHNADSVRDLYMHGTAKDRLPCTFSFSGDQQQRFREHFVPIVADNLFDYDNATTLRSALTMVRIAMVLTVCREWFDNGTLGTSVVCNEQDFQTALALAEAARMGTDTIINRLRSRVVAHTLPPPRRSNLEFFERLPEEFKTSDAKELADQIGVSRSKMFELLGDSRLFEKTKHGHYRKLPPDKP